MLCRVRCACITCRVADRIRVYGPSGVGSGYRYRGRRYDVFAMIGPSVVTRNTGARVSVREIRRARERIRVLWSAGMRWFQNPGRARDDLGVLLAEPGAVGINARAHKVKNSLAERDDFGSCKTTIVAPFFTQLRCAPEVVRPPIFYVYKFKSDVYNSRVCFSVCLSASPSLLYYAARPLLLQR